MGEATDAVTITRCHKAACSLEKDMEEMSFRSDEYDQTAKAPGELDAMIAKYHRDVKASRIEANRRHALEGM
jgi:hypothetical protein